MPRALLLALALSFFPALGHADEPPPFRVPDGWRSGLFAANPDLSNPVAFCLDERGRVYVAEEFRFNRGTEENRTRPFLLEDDLQIRTLDDRLVMYRKFADRFEGGMGWFTRYSDRVRLLEDRDGDGRSDRATVFADGFNGVLDGLAAGVIARDGDVFFTCIPNLWRLRDNDGDGKAEVREVVHRGFGVNAAFLGHDLHGLAWGPDGRLYFSVGDRGFHVQTREGKTLSGPRRGGVFRCEPDGSGLELVAQGLRNPQELAFDDDGNLFAVDNNCDKGDDSRLVFVLEGGDSGWNMAYQTIPTPYLTGPWHAEKLWHLPHPGQPAWIVPPVGKLGAGPSGFAAYPGVGLPDRYRGYLFYCNFTSDGGVEAFGLQPKGAGFAMTDWHKVVTPVNATDVDFGYDGRMYLSEFGRLEWDGSNDAGRIFWVEAPGASENPVVAQPRTLFREGFAKRTQAELIGLLGHPDRRVRQRSQYALAAIGQSAVPGLREVLTTGKDRKARLHALWALGQIGRKSPEGLEPLLAALADSDPLIRARAAGVLGDARHKPSLDRLIPLLEDPDDHVKLAAGLALGRLHDASAVKPLLAFLRRNVDRDPFLRHAGVMGLLGSIGAESDPEASARLIREHGADPSAAVRRALVLVARRNADPSLARFLDDADPSIVAEASRAINDVPIDAATEALARVLGRQTNPTAQGRDALIRRVLHANYRIGRTPEAKAVAAFAADASQSAELRAEALAALSDWNAPPPRDRVNGFWRPLPTRDPAPLREAVEARASDLLKAPESDLRAKAIGLIERSGAKADGPTFLAMVVDASGAAEVRLAALRLLASRRLPALSEAVLAALASSEPTLRAEGRRVLAKEDPATALAMLGPIARSAVAPVAERQGAIETLGTLSAPGADELLAGLVADLAEGRVAPEVHLELIEAAKGRRAEVVAKALEQYRGKATAPGDALGEFRPSLQGGDAARGRLVFTDHAQAQCVRCHRIAGRGGSTGPELSTVAARADRENLLRSLIDPDAAIAEGFGTTTLALKDGRVVAGVVKREDAGGIRLETPGGRVETIPAVQVEERSRARSAMPKMGAVLSPRELRDLLAYLATLK